MRRQFYRILIADDDDLVRESICSGVDWNSLGFEVAAAVEDGEKAIEVLQNTPIDIVITDIKMPFVNGLELAKIIEEVYPEIHVIIISGHSEFEYAKQAIAYGVDEYLLKPVNRKELTQVLGKVCQRIDSQREAKTLMEKYRAELEASKPVLKARFLEGLVSGEYTEDEIVNKAHAYGIPLKDQAAVVVVFDVDFSKLGQMETIQKDAYRLSVMEEAKLVCNSAAWLFSFFDGMDKLVVGFLAEESLADDLDVFVRAYKAKFGLPVTAAIGMRVDKKVLLKESYDTASQAMEQKFVFGSGKVFRYDDLKGLATNIVNPAKHQAEIIKAIKMDDRQTWMLAFDEYFEVLYQANMPKSFSKLKIMELVSKLLTLKLEVEENEQVQQDMIVFMKSIQDLEFLEHGKEKLLRLAEETAESIRVYQRDQYSKLVRDVKGYLEGNYQDSSVNLKSTAAHFYVSHSYLSTVFRKEMGETFVEFLTGLRIEKAKQLLKTTSQKLYEVADQSGFNDQYYFSATFKKKVGVSPKVYKQSLDLLE